MQAECFATQHHRGFPCTAAFVLLVGIATLPLHHLESQQSPIALTAQAALRGVVADSTGQPIVNATVAVDALRLRVRSGSSGEYRLATVRTAHSMRSPYSDGAAV